MVCSYKTIIGPVEVFCLFSQMVCRKTSIGPVQVFYRFPKIVHRYKTSIGPLEVHHYAEMVCLHKSSIDPENVFYHFARNGVPSIPRPVLPQYRFSTSPKVHFLKSYNSRSNFAIKLEPGRLLDIGKFLYIVK